MSNANSPGKVSSTNTPSRDETSMYNTALENLTFSSIMNSDNENTNTSLNQTSDYPLHISESQDSTLQYSSGGDQDSSLYGVDSFLEDGTEVLLSGTRYQTPKRKRRSISIDDVIVISSGEESINGREENETFDRTSETMSTSTNEFQDLSSVSIGGVLSPNQTLPASSTEEKEKVPTGVIAEPETIKMYASLEEFEKNLPETVTLLTTPHGSKVYLVGTAHFSKESQDDVSTVIRNVRPNVVVVELCPSRVHILTHDATTLLEEARDINLTKVRNIIHTNGMINGVFYILLLQMSAKLTKLLGMAPGGEFRRAFEELQALPHHHERLILGDRPINITLQRALALLSPLQTIRLVWRLITFNEPITKEDVEQCKRRDLLEELMAEMADEFPSFGEVFVHERDLYLSYSLHQAACLHSYPVKVVGVVGIGHSAGIAKHWGRVDYSRIPDIMIIPAPSLSKRIFKKTIKYGTICLITYGIFRFVRPKITRFL